MNQKRSRRHEAKSEPIPAAQNAAAESISFTSQRKFWPKNPVMKVSGRKTLATIVSLRTMSFCCAEIAF